MTTSTSTSTPSPETPARTGLKVKTGVKAGGTCTYCYDPPTGRNHGLKLKSAPRQAR